MRLRGLLTFVVILFTLGRETNSTIATNRGSSRKILDGKPALNGDMQ